MAKGKKGSNRSDARPSSLTVTLRSRPPLPPNRLTENLKAPASVPARLISGAVARIGVEAPKKKTKKGVDQVPYQIAFSAPAETIICVRRSRRKEVLHALKKTGKRGQRKPRRSTWRHYKC